MASSTLEILSLLLMFSAPTLFSLAVVETLPGFPGKLPFKLQTGYIGVGESQEIQLFYYFIESENSPETDPLLLWLTGGPSCSGLSALFYEIGPLTINYANSTGDIPALKLNPYAWTKVANIIFVDQPVGTGYSYAQTSDAYKTNDTLSAQHTYSFLVQWLLDHPTFLSNPLYVGGDSYSGITLPLVVHNIYDGLESGIEPRLNIKVHLNGYIEGNPLTDRFSDLNNRMEYGYRMGFLSDNLYKSTKESCNGNYINEHPQSSRCQYDLQRVSKCTEKINMAQILEPVCNEESLLSLNGENLPQQWCRDDNYLFGYSWANNKIVQKALGVREGTITEWVRCNQTLRGPPEVERTEAYVYNVKTTVDYHRSFTNKSCRVLIYSGDHDMIVPHVSTEEWIESLKVAVEDEWRPWFVEDQIAGYTIKYSQNEYELTYATVKGAGHTAPEYKPQQCLPMIQRWLSIYPL